MDSKSAFSRLVPVLTAVQWAVLCACWLFGLSLSWAGFYELFVNIPGAHFARIQSLEGRVQVFFNVQTLCALGTCLGALMSLHGCGSASIKMVRNSNLGSSWKNILGGLGLSLLAQLIAFYDFLTYAFRGVG